MYFLEWHLEKAYLVDARFEMTLLDGAHLDGAELMGADLRGAVGLSAEQLKDAIGDRATKLPGHVAPPGHWLEQGLKAHAAEVAKDGGADGTYVTGHHQQG